MDPAGLKIYHSNDDSFHIDNLNNDCLIHIFEFLTIKERLKIERVSKRWNEVSKQSWSKVKDFEVEEKSEDFFPREYCLDGRRKTMFTNFYVSVLKKSSIYLNKLKLIANKIENFLEFEKVLIEFSNDYRNLTHLIIEDHLRYRMPKFDRIFTDECLSRLFNSTINLTTISLVNLDVNGSCFLNLRAEQIKELTIKDCNFKHKNYFNAFLSNINNLNKLDVNLCDTIFDEFLKIGFNNIFEISFRSWSKETENFIKFLAIQKNLHKLNLRCTNENIMKSLPVLDHLEELNIKFNYVNDSVWYILKRFHNLKVLEIESKILTVGELKKISENIADTVTSIILKCRKFNLDDPGNQRRFRNDHYVSGPDISVYITQILLQSDSDNDDNNDNDLSSLTSIEMQNYLLQNYFDKLPNLKFFSFTKKNL